MFQTYRTSTVGRAGLAGVLSALVAAAALAQAPVGSEFSYQGFVRLAGSALDEDADFQFTLWDAAVGGTLIAGPLAADGVPVVDGLFTQELDFGVSAIDGNARWLEIAVRRTAAGGAYMTLSPRQPLGAAPYSVQTRGLFVDAAGRIGVGTTAPSEFFAMTLNTARPGILMQSTSDALPAGLRLRSGLGGEWDIFAKGASDDLVIDDTAGGAEVMHLSRVTGYVGLGTSAPKRTLHNTGDYYGRGHLYLYSYNGDGTSGTAFVQARDDSGTSSISMQLRTQRDGSYTDVMSLTPEGNVGVGTGSPLAKLHVNGALRSGAITAPAIQLSDTVLTNTLTATGPVTALQYYGDGSSLTNLPSSPWVQNLPDVYYNNGDVGIGTTNPTAPLHVARTEGILLGNTTAGSTNLQMSLTAAAGGAAQIQSVSSSGTDWGELQLNPNGGQVSVPVLRITGGADIAEPFHVNPAEARDEYAAPGMLVCIDPARPGQLRVSGRAYDRTVAGVISGAGGVKPGMTLQQDGTIASGEHPVALTGRVYCYVDADAGGPVAPGDLLTTSDTPGHAMKAADAGRAPGAVIGKAMSSLESGKGLVLVLVNLQ